VCIRQQTSNKTIFTFGITIIRSTILLCKYHLECSGRPFYVLPLSIVIFRLHKFATLTPGCIYTKMRQLKKKPIQCIMRFYINLAGIGGLANDICKHKLSGQQFYSVNITLNVQDVHSMFSPYLIDIELVFTIKTNKFSIAYVYQYHYSNHSI
jgi:hypothetical protein